MSWPVPFVGGGTGSRPSLLRRPRTPSSLGLSPADTWRRPSHPLLEGGLDPVHPSSLGLALPPLSASRPLTGRHLATALPPPSPRSSFLLRPLAGRNPTAILLPPLPGCPPTTPGPSRVVGGGTGSRPSLLPRPRHSLLSRPLGLSPADTWRRPSLLHRRDPPSSIAAILLSPSASRRTTPDRDPPSSHTRLPPTTPGAPSLLSRPFAGCRQPSVLPRPLTTALPPPSPRSSFLPRPLTGRHPTAILLPPLSGCPPTTPQPPPSSLDLSTGAGGSLLPRPLTGRHLATALPPPSPCHRHPDRPSLLSRPFAGCRRPSVLPRPLTTALPPPSPRSSFLPCRVARRKPPGPPLPPLTTSRRVSAALPPPSASRPTPGDGPPPPSPSHRHPDRPSLLPQPLTDTPTDPPSSRGPPSLLSPGAGGPPSSIALSPGAGGPPSSLGLSPTPRPTLPLLGATRQHPGGVKTAVQYTQPSSLRVVGGGLDPVPSFYHLSSATQ